MSPPSTLGPTPLQDDPASDRIKTDGRAFRLLDLVEVHALTPAQAAKAGFPQRKQAIMEVRRFAPFNYTN
jgi:hypothetical protein